MNCTSQVCEWKKTENETQTTEYSSLPFQGQFGFKESDDDDGKSTGTSN